MTLDAIPHLPVDTGALLFDLGGVVFDVDFNRVFARWAHLSNQTLGKINERFSFDLAYEKHETGQLTSPEYFQTLRRSVGLELSDEEFADGWNCLVEGVIAGIPQLLGAAARSLPLFAFTNSNPTHRHLWTDVYAADLDVFREVFISSDIGLRKPAADAFQAVADRMGLLPQRIHFFDDTQENVDGAAAIGMTATHVTSVESIAGALGSFE